MEENRKPPQEEGIEVALLYLLIGKFRVARQLARGFGAWKWEGHEAICGITSSKIPEVTKGNPRDHRKLYG